MIAGKVSRSIDIRKSDTPGFAFEFYGPPRRGQSVQRDLSLTRNDLCQAVTSEAMSEAARHHGSPIEFVQLAGG
jgi:hypothetical protein